MSRGWAKGTQAFKKAVLDDPKDANLKRLSNPRLRKCESPAGCTAHRYRLFTAFKQTGSRSSTNPESSTLEISDCTLLCEQHLVPYRWIAKRLRMGQVSSLRSTVSRTRKLDHKQFNEWDIIKKHEILDCLLQTVSCPITLQQRRADHEWTPRNAIRPSPPPLETEIITRIELSP